jgi:hypothetical protein
MIFEQEKGKSINTLRSTELSDSSLKFGFAKHFLIKILVASVDMKELCIVYSFLFTKVVFDASRLLGARASSINNRIWLK